FNGVSGTIRPYYEKDTPQVFKQFDALPFEIYNHWDRGDSNNGLILVLKKGHNVTGIKNDKADVISIYGDEAKVVDTAAFKAQSGYSVCREKGLPYSFARQG